MQVDAVETAAGYQLDVALHGSPGVFGAPDAHRRSFAVNASHANQDALVEMLTMTSQDHRAYHLLCLLGSIDGASCINGIKSSGTIAVLFNNCSHLAAVHADVCCDMLIY